MDKPYLRVKRCCDLALSLILAIPVAIIVAFCCLAIRMETKGPVFFAQERPGYKGKLFTIYKLRTMIVQTQRDGRALSDMERMTRSGRVIRKLSLDELPQLFNILLGEMSFIGPRPLLPAYLPLYSAQEMCRHDVLPGISGWAQVNGRNELSWAQKFERDVWYVDHISLALDCRILWMTLVNVIKRQGINAGVNDTMEAFTSSKETIPR